jgi:hypothetical protein
MAVGGRQNIPIASRFTGRVNLCNAGKSAVDFASVEKPSGGGELFSE